MHIFARIVVFALLLSITIPYLVLSYPNGAGTCDVTAMSSQGHGAPLTSGAGGFSLTLVNSTTASGSYSITVKGPKSVKGLLLYTQDSKGTRTGNFVVPSKFQSKSCSGTGTNSLTHKDSSQKSLPLSFTWSPESGSATNITARAIVVVSYSDWYQLSDLTFDPSSGFMELALKRQQVKARTFAKTVGGFGQ
ncbi:8012_t:CDS:2 [Acaulospora morrowiae]|uniref:8012_t:CDS:1 n=1 Tax=Acaulospora morrowiae TaxID=94023 RepID=A0A9N8WIM1_9GLOM|nr:8012_t:CDS:2 [Acaulospora morrowiae]